MPLASAGCCTSRAGFAFADFFGAAGMALTFGIADRFVLLRMGLVLFANGSRNRQFLRVPLLHSLLALLRSIRKVHACATVATVATLHCQVA